MKDMLAEQEHAALIDGIGRRIGTGIAPVRRRAVEAALLEIAKRRGLGGIRDLYRKMGVDRELTDEVVSLIAVGETYFLRDLEQLELIRDTVLPDVLRRRPFRSQPTIWCAGCSTGEEPYSLAILMEEKGLGDRIRIIATDISATALNEARSAEYGQWSLRNATPALLSRFTRTHNRYRLDRHIARRVQFVRHRLGGNNWPPPGLANSSVDIILCRNVLMYMDHEAVAKAAQQLYDCLAEGGWLLTGPSDPPIWSLAPFETQITASGVSYRRPDSSRGAVGGPACRYPGRWREQKNLPQVVHRRKSIGKSPLGRRVHPLRLSHDAGAGSIAARVAALLREEDAGAAETAAEDGVGRFPLSAELHYLHGLAMMAMGRREAAIIALRRSIYLDRTLEAPRFKMAACLEEDSLEAALRELKSALSVSSARNPEEQVPLMESVTAASFAEMTRMEISRLRASVGGVAR